ncbi:MAG: insulinase family protein [Rhodobacteraceae bacterium]|nr:insulinase family protein [Paracoccaceae bacterium]
MRQILGLAALALIWGPMAVAQQVPVTNYTLDNGMEVVVIEDNRAPIVTHMVWYRVGAADEPAGKSGIAHFLEHLMFKGTEAVPDGTFGEVVEANGGEDNAFTSQDYTAYFQQVAVDRLPMMMEMEADRMRGLILDDAAMLTERDVVIEERALRTDSDPGSLFSEQRNAAQFLNHPYGTPIIGWPNEVAALTLEDALDFYGQFYAPNNAILVVAGDVRPEEVLALARQYYGPLQPSEGIKNRLRPQEPPQRAERRLTYRDPRVATPYVIRTYLAENRQAGNQQEAAALGLLADVLGGGGITSLLGQRLQLDEGIALSTGAFYSGLSYDRDTFGVYVVPKPDTSLEEAEARLDATLEYLIENGVDADRLARSKASLLASEIYAMDSQMGLARRYGAALTSGLTVKDVQDWPDILQAVTAEDIQEAARGVLDIRQSVTGYLMGEKESDQ